jgi:hypothetical protein
VQFDALDAVYSEGQRRPLVLEPSGLRARRLTRERHDSSTQRCAHNHAENAR